MNSFIKALRLNKLTPENPTNPSPTSTGKIATTGKEFCSSLTPATSPIGEGEEVSNTTEATSSSWFVSSVSLVLGVEVALRVDFGVTIGVAVGF